MYNQNTNILEDTNKTNNQTVKLKQITVRHYNASYKTELQVTDQKCKICAK